MLANLEVKWLYDVIALEESRSFTLAAKTRNISQSSFSRRIQALEASLGFSIFDRGLTRCSSPLVAKFSSAMREICWTIWTFRLVALRG
ncbi:cell density-dependent motility repressor [Raoultella terrigena]|nr:cell density-dependent motility repressor [Raoultella terrigena]